MKLPTPRIRRDKAIITLLPVFFAKAKTYPPFSAKHNIYLVVHPAFAYSPLNQSGAENEDEKYPGYG